LKKMRKLDTAPDGQEAVKGKVGGEGGGKGVTSLCLRSWQPFQRWQMAIGHH
jgi:hypothetical protein